MKKKHMVENMEYLKLKVDTLINESMRKQQAFKGMQSEIDSLKNRADLAMSERRRLQVRLNDYQLRIIKLEDKVRKLNRSHKICNACGGESHHG